MVAELFNITVHSPDPERLARFWSEALGFPVAQVGPGLVRLAGSGAPNAPDLLVLAGDPTGGSALHLDLAADDVDAEVGRLCSLGATLVDPPSASGPTARTANGIAWVVLADPDGNEFCVGAIPERDPDLSPP